MKIDKTDIQAAIYLICCITGITLLLVSAAYWIKSIVTGGVFNTSALWALLGVVVVFLLNMLWAVISRIK